MKSKVQRRKVFLSALCLSVAALWSPAVSSAQTREPTTADSTAATDVGVGTGPTGIASDSSGDLWVTLQFSNKLVKLGSGGAVLGTYKVGRGPFGLIAVGPNIFVSCFFDGVVLKLSGSSGEALTRVAVGDGAAGLANYGQNYVVANNGSNSITVFSADGAVISTISVGRSPLYVAANAYGYWSANTGSDTVSKR